MSHLYSASTNAFFHRGVHAADKIPADAVAISARRHRELLAGQGEGRAISAGKDGKPQLEPKQKPTLAFLRRLAVADIKREAKRRILAIASLERQANDNAAMAAYAIDLAAGQPVGSPLITNAAHAAVRRRDAIDAIRAASNQLEATIATWSAGALGHFTAAEAAHWPKDSPR
ncbi:MAG: hypothetical protein V4475_01890 [Pseudomonadota bacterium]